MRARNSSSCDSNPSTRQARSTHIQLSPCCNLYSDSNSVCLKYTHIQNHQRVLWTGWVMSGKQGGAPDSHIWRRCVHCMTISKTFLSSQHKWVDCAYTSPELSELSLTLFPNSPSFFKRSWLWHFAKRSWSPPCSCPPAACSPCFLAKSGAYKINSLKVICSYLSWQVLFILYFIFVRSIVIRHQLYLSNHLRKFSVSSFLSFLFSPVEFKSTLRTSSNHSNISDSTF